MKYNVSIRETLVKSIEVEANSIDEAKAIAKQEYNDENIVLEYDDFTGDVDARVYDENFNALEDWDESFLD